MPLGCHGRQAAGGLLAVALALAAAAIPAQASARHVKRARTTHHGDPRRALRHAWGRGPRAHAAANSLAVLPATWCGTETTADTGSPLSNAPQIKVVYAYAHDQIDRFPTYKDLIQSDVNAIRQRLDTDTGDAKSVRFDLGNVAPGGGCAGTPATRYADIQVVHLPRLLATYNGGGSVFTMLKTDVIAAAGPPAPGARTDYVVYADGISQNNYAGQGDLRTDDSHGYGNAVDSADHAFAMIYGYGGPDFVGGDGADSRMATFLHELSHTQGAVQYTAPHASGAGHCYDEQDIMCYDDGGSYFTHGGSVQTNCDLGAPGFGFAQTYDCSTDDYFNPAPAGGSYLAGHWNVFDSVYLCAVAKCDSALGPPSVTLTAPATAYRGTSPTLTAGVTGATVQHYEWDLDGDGQFELDTGTSPSTTVQLTAAGDLAVRVRATTPDGTFGTDTKTIAVAEPTTPTPSFTVSTNTPLVGQTVAFDASPTSDPSGVITSYRWDFDGNGTVDLDAGLAKTAATSYPTAGARLVGLEVDYPLGFSKSFVQVVATAPQPAEPDGGGNAAAPAKSPQFTATLPRLAKLLKSGLPLSVTCGAACALTARLTVTAATARALHLAGPRGKPVAIGTVTRSAAAAGAFKVAITLTAAAKKALKHAPSVTVTLGAQLTQAGFQPLVVKKSLQVRR